MGGARRWHKDDTAGVGGTPEEETDFYDDYANRLEKAIYNFTAYDSTPTTTTLCKTWKRLLLLRRPDRQRGHVVLP
jgi:hypothetical protein